MTNDNKYTNNTKKLSWKSVRKYFSPFPAFCGYFQITVYSYWNLYHWDEKSKRSAEPKTTCFVLLDYLNHDLCAVLVWEPIFQISEAANQGCFLEKVFWKYATNLQENTPWKRQKTSGFKNYHLTSMKSITIFTFYFQIYLTESSYTQHNALFWLNFILKKLLVKKLTT